MSACKCFLIIVRHLELQKEKEKSSLVATGISKMLIASSKCYMYLATENVSCQLYVVLGTGGWGKIGACEHQELC